MCLGGRELAVVIWVQEMIVKDSFYVCGTIKDNWT